MDSTEILQGMYAAEGEYLAAGGPGVASFDVMAPYFAPDVALHQAEALPYGGVWHGYEGMERFMAKMTETWEVFDMVEQDFLSTGSTSVVLTQIHARSRATGRELDFPILQTLEIEDGRIAEVRPFYWDTEEIAAACDGNDRS